MSRSGRGLRYFICEGANDQLMISNYQFARMALGFPQCLSGVNPLFRPLIRRKTAKKLAEFQKGPL